jgi:dipeptidyl-peptidase-4
VKPGGMTLRYVAAILLLAALPWLAASGPAMADGDLTLDAVFAREPLWGRMIDRVSWSPDGKGFLYERRGQDPEETLPLMSYDVALRTSRVWARPGTFGGVFRTPSVEGWSADGRHAAPHGDAFAFARAAELFVARLSARAAVTQVTRGGLDGSVVNGTLDWVYPEELGIERGFRWSPDATRIAYLRFDERPVTNFPIVDFMTVGNAVEYQRYPLAGQHNPRVSLRVINVTHGPSDDHLVYDAGKRDEYVAAFDWLPRTDALEAEILNRRQTDLRVDVYLSGAAPSTTVYRQRAPSWVDVVPLPVWLRDGASVWLLDRGTTAGIFRRSRDGTLRRLTGNYRVFDPIEVAAGGTAYAVGAYPTRRDRSLLEVSPNGTVRNLTPAPGAHAIALAPTFDRFVDVHSRLNQPPQADLVTVASPAVTTLAPQSALLTSELLPVEMLEVPSPYGPLDATLLRPPGFDAAKKYPVVVYVYGGPDAPTTADRFGGLYHQLLARQGIIVFSIDGPASQVDSDTHVGLLLRNFGPGSLLGQEIGARYLASLPYVDATRIGIWGWSFGGYETCYALTHSAYFKAGAAVAPVTDWHLYDTIYTERYMGLPNENADAYARSSVLNAAGRLAGPLLVQHGTADDNVHMANSMRLVQQFILAHEARVTFYPYPRKQHPIAGLAQQRSVYAHMLQFWKANL